MMKSLLRLLQVGLLVAAPTLAAAQVALRDGHPEIYYVKQGDNLWNIASQFLDSPWQWPELWHVNQEIENPHLIYPGDEIRLIYVDGQPRLQLVRDDAVVDPTEPKPQDPRTETVKMTKDGKLVKLTPRARVLPLDAAIPAIPLERIEPYLIDALVLSARDINESPYVIGGEDARVVFGDGDEVYARDPFKKWENLVQSYGFYRVGEEYVDPETNEVLGYEALQIGLGRVANSSGETTTLRVVESSADIRAADRVMTTREQRMQSIFYPSSPDVAIDARVIRFFNRLNSVAKNDVVVLNKGERDGLNVGHVLEVHQAGAVVKDNVRDELVQLPSVKAGTIIIFRSFEKVSYGLIIESTLPVRMLDHATNPVGTL